MKGIKCQLGSRAEKEAPGVRDEWAEIGHRADPQKNERRVDAQFDSLVEVIDKPSGKPILRPVGDAAHRKICE